MRTTPATINKITHWLRISAERYTELVHEAGCNYIERYEAQTLLSVPEEKHKLVHRFAATMKSSTVFWWWWKYETEATDRAFLRTGSRSIALWEQMHCEAMRVPPQKIIDLSIAERLHKQTETA